MTTTKTPPRPTKTPPRPTKTTTGGTFHYSDVFGTAYSNSKDRPEMVLFTDDHGNASTPRVLPLAAFGGTTGIFGRLTREIEKLADLPAATPVRLLTADLSGNVVAIEVAVSDCWQQPRHAVKVLEARADHSAVAA